jgi:hypothetical protein
MRYAVAMASLLAILALANRPQNPSGKQAGSLSIGLQVGERAPAFSASDQFGQQQSNQTLRGANGTVLLFFRSADW